MELSDKEIKKIIQKAQKGDQDSFAKIYDIFFTKIYRYIFFRTSDKEQAEDLTSLVFLKVWQNLAKYKIKKNAKFSTWLFQVARFTLIDYYRSRKDQVSIEDIKTLPDNESIGLYVEISEVKEYILQLPEEYQTVINLRHFSGLDFIEIGKIMGKTAVSARVLNHRALNKISKLMKSKNEPE